MPEIPAPELPAWRTDPLPSGLKWVDTHEPWEMTDLQATLDGSSQPSMSADSTYIALDDYASPIKYPRRLKVLEDWATQHGVFLKAHGSDSITIPPFYTASVYSTFRVRTQNSGSRIMQFGPSVCHCGEEVPMGTLTHSCTTDTMPLYCHYCRWSTAPMILDEGTLVCLWCAAVCLECPTRISPQWNMCTDHGSRLLCSNCDSTDYVSEENGVVLCDACWEARCGLCNARWHDDYYLEDYGSVCRSCYNGQMHGLVGNDTEEDDTAANVDDFIQPTIPGRELIRHCGIEIEGAGSYMPLIVGLHGAGLTNQRDMNGYHWTTRIQTERLHDEMPAATSWSIESDSSVDWELVSPKLNMADSTDVAQLNTAIQTVRQTIRAGDVSLDLRCGLHVHVAAAQIPVGGAYKLKGYWDYLEDVMFRLGAAKWPIHRAIVNGGEYTRATPKNGMSTKLDFARHYERNNDRYYALSFANYFRAFLENCQCGAVRYDTWDNCTCDLGKCTFEFRVFNTSANPTKIHAYLALCQALVAKAAQGEDVENIQAELPPMTFEPVAFKKGTPQQQAMLREGWEPRLRWLFNELPLTEAEKNSLMYCVENSELNNLDPSFVRSLNPNQFAMEVGA